jgi:hypothetical protein
LELFVSPRAIAGARKKISLGWPSRCLPRHFFVSSVPSAALCICDFELDEHAFHDQFSDTCAWPSTLSILPPGCGNARCNSVPEDGPAGIDARSLSANTCGCAAAARFAL